MKKIREYCTLLLCGELMLGLVLISFLISLPVRADMVTNAKDSTTQQVKYPPYLDVWDWQIPKIDKSTDPSATPIIRVKTMDNGDIMIAYQPDAGKPVVKYVTFFGKIILNDKEADAVYKKNYTGDQKSRIRFKGDSFLQGGGSGMRSGGCYDALGFHVVIYDKTETKNLNDKRLLYVLDKPKYYETHHPHCMDGQSFYYRVEAVDSKFLPLKDGTFLLVANEGYVIRFDENFQTKSKLMNNKFFWMDESEWLEFWKNGAYGDRAEGDVNFKKMYTDLYNLLMNKKRRGK